MLTHIYIRDFAIIDTLDLELKTGMSALTGETGAGKSILVDAIGLVLGDRADSGVVRHGAKQAEIILSVDISRTPVAKKWLEEHALNQDDSCILRRVISATGKSRAWINGSPSTLGLLRQLGEQLVEIHGQHEHQSLMKKEKQRQLLDDFAQNGKLLTVVKNAYQQWKHLNDYLTRLNNQSSDHQAKLDLLHFQLQELDTLALTHNEYASLDKEYAILSNAEQLLAVSKQSIERLYDADEQSLYSQLSIIINDIEQQQQLDERFKEPHELLLSAQIQLQEATDTLRQHQDAIALDPERLHWVENRLSDIHSLARKHHTTAENLYEKWRQLNDELAVLSTDEYDLEALDAKCNKLKTDYVSQAKKISKSRQRSAKKLAKGVSDAMQPLGMQGGIFNISVTFIEDGNISPHGLDHIDFEVSANPGQPLKPLVKVASGGELSRISLAIQMIAAQQITLPALIFDEVDSGIGGGTAEVVGQQLRHIANNLQVLCITHLPQVASQAHHHYKVNKVKEKSTTSTAMLKLTHHKRVIEIARMMGGIEITESTLNLAKEMLKN
jgi:DNA repair protein RecN (Recombination protein N)